MKYSSKWPDYLTWAWNLWINLEFHKRIKFSTSEMLQRLHWGRSKIGQRHFLYRWEAGVSLAHHHKFLHESHTKCVLFCFFPGHLPVLDRTKNWVYNYFYLWPKKLVVSKSLKIMWKEDTNCIWKEGIHGESCNQEKADYLYLKIKQDGIIVCLTTRDQQWESLGVRVFLPVCSLLACCMVGIFSVGWEDIYVMSAHINLCENTSETNRDTCVWIPPALTNSAGEGKDACTTHNITSNGRWRMKVEGCSV